ncbi:MAG: hypothetical protein NT102_03220 [Caldiserica bacterium]|nr:hypothetical protein [Caldisericota bacterium]
MSEEHVTRHERVLALVGVAVVVLAAIAVRASVQFGTNLIPGMNGAYYLVQVRAVIEKGHLAEHDMPLIFWLQAGLARLVQAISTLTLDSSIVLTSKLFDSIVPALAAIPAFLLAVRWPSSRHSVWAGIAAATLAVLSSGPLRMIGDFQKNALGMLWALSCAYCLQQGLNRRSWRYLAAAGLFLGLVGVTHIGAFGVTLALVALVVLAWALLASSRPRRALLAIAGGAIGVAGLLGVLMILGDSTRITRLLTLLAAPLSLFRSSGMGGSARLGSWLRLQDPQTFILSLVLSLAAGAVLIWRRHEVHPWERALVVASAVLALFLSSPFLSQDMSSRFQLMAFAPAVILISFVAARSGIPALRFALVIGTIAVVLASIPATVRSPNRPSIVEASYTELASLQTSITDPSHTLIIARHGLEWWAAWALHTDVAQATAVTDTDWTTYTSVLYLQETGNSIGAGMGAPGITVRPQLPVGSASTRPALRARMPPTGTAPVGSGSTSGTTLPQRGGVGGMTPPSDASTVHSGTYFALSSLPTPATALGNPGGGP